jgi:hypothetical protein
MGASEGVRFSNTSGTYVHAPVNVNKKISRMERET